LNSLLYYTLGLNPVDYKIRNHWIPDWPQALPIITGWDIAGVVVEAGAEVQDFKVGDEVYAYNRPAFDNPTYASTESVIGVDGCCAEFVKVAEWKIAHKPKSVSFAEASGIPLACLTSYQAIFEHGNLQPGQNLLVLNASGGTGSFAVQLAVNRGCNVVGTCSSRNKEFVESLGATVIDYTTGNVAEQLKAIFPNGADVVYDCIGGDDTLVGIECVSESGIIVSIAHFTVHEVAAAAGKRGTAFLVQVSGQQLSEIANLVDEGKLKVARVTEYPLSRAIKAFEVLETHRVTGKIVLTNE
jgi:NADPH:quinone reductase-like Zn-dependent oxidoreductase